ncbi:MAG: hypothetical protein HXY34_07105 [Candidatus Thorarchaeota archaeon]|nr:hypothetical protein [Candidatus Thorarchaeota archaeon]
MRVKAVLRDTDVLAKQPGSAERILASAEKNLDRVVNLNSLLKVMGLPEEGRIAMLQALAKSGLHIWLGAEGGQDLVFITRDALPDEIRVSGYQWQ